MQAFPKDPHILVSTINMFLRDEEFDSLDQLCYCYDEDPEAVLAFLAQHGYVYDVDQHQMKLI